MKLSDKINMKTIGFTVLTCVFMFALAAPVLHAAALSDVEKEKLLYMVEEEKLARDVYQALNTKWNHRTFANITKSEQQHMDELKALFPVYALPDPTKGKKPGEFANQKLQTLYTELVQKGSQSLNDAFAVGIQIEKLDIADLEEAISKTTHNDVTQAYKNLLRGSNNHLQAFSSQTGESGRVGARGRANRP